MIFSGQRASLFKSIPWLAVATLSVALWTGCATGGSGHTQGPLVTVTAAGNAQNVAVTLTLQFTATVTHSNSTAVTWSVKQNGSACSDCGSVDSSGLYTAPAKPPANSDKVDVTATLQSDANVSGKSTIIVLPVTVTVMPTNKPLVIAKGVTQQFSSRAVPDTDPRAQGVTWSVVDSGGADCTPGCGTIDSNGLYTAPNANVSATVQAVSTIDPTGISTVKIAVGPSRLVQGIYAFHLSGVDANGNALAVAGNIQVNSNGAIFGGVEDELTATAHSVHSITAGSLTLDNNTHGSMTLVAGATHHYKVVFTASGDGKLIEFDNRSLSGEIALATSKAKNLALLPSGSTFVFGLSGAASVGRRTGFVGLFHPDGAGNIGTGTAAPGKVDFNDGTSHNAATDVSGAYTINSDGSGTMQLVSSLGTFNYSIYVAGGVTNNNANNPLTLFVISTDPPLSSPAVTGKIVFQDPSQTYDNTALKNLFVTSLTGLNGSGGTSVSLTTALGDGASSNAKVSGFVDANNAGTIVSAQSFTCPYAADSGGRYTITLLGNGTSCTSGIPFVLYAIGAARGFLLDQSSSAVVFGQMDPQPISNLGEPSVGGPFVAASANLASSDASNLLQNVFMTALAPSTFTLTGQQDENDSVQIAGQSLTGTYSIPNGQTEAVQLKITPQGQAERTYIMYVLDDPKSFGFMAQHFVMFDADSSNQNPALIYGER